MNLSRLGYALDGLFRRVHQRRLCPSCRSNKFEKVDRKGFHELYRCRECRLLFRYPYETAEEMARFYERAYCQPGLTTDLPDILSLRDLLAVGFRGTQKDFTRIVELFEALRLAPGSSVLDFGANWGYGVWQLKRAGYNTIGYELAEARAAFSRELGVNVFTKWSDIVARAPFDVVFSCHVLEHTPDPSAALRRKIDVLARGGTLVALMPNGSEAFRRSQPDAFHRLWGQVHPVMLNDEFMRRKFRCGHALGACIRDDLEALASWDRVTPWDGTISTSELLFVWSNLPGH
jgi:2-polyprenyl-3-methyl-5-hydroxy-6-metoxy-1,4-benzoquinol methylase